MLQRIPVALDLDAKHCSHRESVSASPTR